jgi:hypothetical protein
MSPTRTIDWLETLEEAQARAAREARPVFLDFFDPT